jgi:hypothetical protein
MERDKKAGRNAFDRQAGRRGDGKEETKGNEGRSGGMKGGSEGGSKG